MKLDEKDWRPGPVLISTKTRVTPSLLRLTWNGYPVHFEEKKGWGFLVPKSKYGSIHWHNVFVVVVECSGHLLDLYFF
jgi:hypothetical protein